MWTNRITTHALVASLLTFLSRAQEQCPAVSTPCSFDGVAIRQASDISDILKYYYIVGLFGVHQIGSTAYGCGPTTVRGILNLEAFMWAINEYSPDRSLVSIGGVGFDSCSRVENTLENVLSFEKCKVRLPGGVDRRNVLAYVGPYTSPEAMTILNLFNDMNRTTVSPAASSATLRSNNSYPYFLRTIPSELIESTIIAKLLNKHSVKFIQVIYQNDMYWKSFFDAFTYSLNSSDICVVTAMTISPNAAPADLSAMIENMITNTALTRVVVLFADKIRARLILEAVRDRNRNGVFQFIGTSAWGNSVDVIQGLTGANAAITLVASNNIDAYTADVNRFYSYLNSLKPATNTYNKKWFTEFWENTFECNIEHNMYLRDCNTSKEDLGTKGLTDMYVPYTLMAVDAIMKGVKTATAQFCQQQYSLCSDLMNSYSRGQKFRDSILTATKTGGQNFFSANGDPGITFTMYTILQVDTNTYQEIYRYQPDVFTQLGARSLIIMPSSCSGDACLKCKGSTVPVTQPVATTTTPKPESTTADLSEGGRYKQLYFRSDQEFTGIYIYNDASSRKEKTRFDLGHQWIIAIGVLAGMGILCVLFFEIYILYKLLGTRIGKQWRTMWLGQLLLFGLFLSFLVLFAYLPVPSKATCGITRFGVGVSYAICFAVLLVKLMVLLTSKNSESLIPGEESSNYLRGIYQFLMFVFVVGVQIVIDVQWLIQIPPDVVKVISNNGQEVWICNHYTWSVQNGYNNMTSFVRTEFENHLLSLVYIMFLIFITTILAMKAHGIITNHRESIFIGVASGFSIPIWIAWTLVGGLNRDHAYAQEFGDACIAFGLFITATMITFAMFLPKVRQLVNMGVEGIYLEDDRDTYYAGSVIMAPPSYKSRPSSVVYVNSSGLYSDPVVIGNGDAVARVRPGSTYSAPVYVKRPESQTGVKGGSVLRVTGDLTGKMIKKPSSEIAYPISYRKTRSEAGGTLKRATSAQHLGAL
ncbi:hypothetical protein CHS0354_034407 [Potamilus streckersoni]|uniref:G-protein coupled receptors family 3 profile domain-containing protein n=1 Tax=Potamilus streckersoni TaxID=2493646 RepID=A0AAE0VQV7_9BIVA|nr:hypothetical protein CHS0354_034407 [Potamilus streckersoni]